MIVRNLQSNVTNYTEERTKKWGLECGGRDAWTRNETAVDKINTSTPEVQLSEEHIVTRECRQKKRKKERKKKKGKRQNAETGQIRIGEYNDPVAM